MNNLQQQQTATKFFPQLKDMRKGWTHVYPVTPNNGFSSIEECEQEITEMEKLDEQLGLEDQYRIKEEQI